MAQIEFDDKIFRDERFFNLCQQLGGRWTAMGAVMDAWRLARDYISPDNPKGLLPLHEWKKKRQCDAIIEVDLAEIVHVSDINMVYVRGAEEKFAWLVAAQIKGRKGGLAKASSATKKAGSATTQGSGSPKKSENSSASPEALYASLGYLALAGATPLTSYLFLNENTEAGECAGARETGPPPAVELSPGEGGFKAVADLLDAIPGHVKAALLESSKGYGGQVFLDAAVLDAFAFHSSRPESVDWDIPQWVSRINAALAHAKKKAPMPFNPGPAPGPRPRAAPLPVEIPVVTAKEALSHISKWKLKPTTLVALARKQASEGVA